MSYEWTFGVFHLFSGIGGGALGFQQAAGDWRGLRGLFRTLGGVDVDPLACEDFERLTGVRATVLDLFSRADYRAFHGHEPPEGWREATPEDLRRAAGGERPDVVFSSPPCKGHSALLPKAKAQSERYAALNRLTVRGIALALEAWGTDPPGLIILENVPRITSRGADLLARIKALLRSYGYEHDDGLHDMGAVGGLGQHRRRYLLVARHPAKVPAFLYRPPAQRVRSIGEILGALPMPDDEASGPMHRLPRLTWRTWVRLALIPAGGDWRDLQKIDPGSYGIVPHFNHVYRVTPWDTPAGAVAGGGKPSSGAISVADPRLPGEHWPGQYRVVRWQEPSRTITGQSSSYGSNAGMAVADPRLGHEPRKGSYRVGDWGQPATTVVGSADVRGSNGMASAADPRMPDRPGRHHAKYRVEAWSEASHTVTGSDRIGSGAPAVADPRVSPDRGRTFKGSPGLMSVQNWNRPSRAVVGQTSVSGGNGPGAVADPRLSCEPRSGAYRVIPWGEPASTVTGAGDVHAQGAAAVADPRLPGDDEQGAWVIVAEDGTWHRPLTTLELAALQGFPTRLRDGSPLVLAGRSHARWRERIGNAVPPPAARAIGEAMLMALIPATVGAWILSPWATAIWVRMVLGRFVKQLRARLERGRGR